MPIQNATTVFLISAQYGTDCNPDAVKQYSTGRIYSWLFDTLPDSDGESDYE
jgi:hypothetical protein